MKNFAQREKLLEAFDPDTYNFVLTIVAVIWFSLGLILGMLFNGFLPIKI